MSNMILVHIFLDVLDNNTKEDYRRSNNVKIRSQRCLNSKGEPNTWLPRPCQRGKCPLYCYV